MGEDDLGAAKRTQMAPLPHSGAGQGREPILCFMQVVQWVLGSPGWHRAAVCWQTRRGK